MSEWQPVTEDLTDSWGWDAPVVWLRDEDGHEALGAWGYEDENYDGDYWFAWHNDAGDLLGFTPTHWRPQ